jgi:hypothetical protein
MVRSKGVPLHCDERDHHVISDAIRRPTRGGRSTAGGNSTGSKILSARAAGLDEFPANARLMPVLAEKIVYPLKNGILNHEMIVRALPATVAGVSAVKGRLQYSGEVDLAKLKKRLAQHLATAERENGVQFDVKPLDLKSLQLVVLLQNSETGEVLQAAAIPVTGAASPAAESNSAGSREAVKKPASGGN